MKLILREEIDNLGIRGDIVNVARGYARNYLLPKRLAVEVTEHNKVILAKERVIYEEKVAKERDAAQLIADKMTGVKLIFKRKVKEERDELYGSVSVSDVADALEKAGFSLEKKQIQLAEPIKNLGEFPVSVKLFSEVHADIGVLVERDAPEPQETQDSQEHPDHQAPEEV